MLPQLVKLTRCVSALSPPPIAASNFPRTCAQPPFCTSKIETSRSPKTNVIILLWLEFKNTFLKLLSCKGGSPAAKGNARYNCATSAPVWETGGRRCVNWCVNWCVNEALHTCDSPDIFQLDSNRVIAPLCCAYHQPRPTVGERGVR